MYHKQVDQLFKTQMIYLTGDKKLHDDSDYEDPCASLNIPANNDYSQRANNNMDNENDGNNSQDDEFNL